MDGSFPDTSFSLQDRKSVRTVTFFAIGAVLLTAAGCGTGSSGPSHSDTISREQFVEAFFHLRKEGLRSPSMEIGLEARNRILQELGLEEEDLLAFAEAWGDDGAMMQSIWEDVDSLLRIDRMEDLVGPEGAEGPEDVPPADGRGGSPS